MDAKLINREEQDKWYSMINGIPLATHFYYMKMTPDFMGSELENLSPISNSGVVLSFVQYPFLDDTDLPLYKIPYDTVHFGNQNDEYFNGKTPYVFKIRGDVLQRPKRIGDVRRYPFEQFPYNHMKDWRNESKLWQYPYHFITINDYINQPLFLRNDIIPSIYPKNIPINVIQPISITGGYTIYVEGYKGDKNRGANEGMLCSAGLDLPTSSSQYAQFMANSKNQFMAQQEASNRNEWMGFGRGALSFVTGAFQAGLGAIAIAGSSGTATMMGAGTMVGAGVLTAGQGVADMIQAGVTQTNRIENAHAMMDDLKSAPRSVTLSSSDLLMSLSRNENAVWANRYTVNDYYKQKLADFWTLYGYKQNKLMLPDLKSRLYFNYIRTLQANVTGNNMDKDVLETIKDIFNAGIRFWHISTGNEKMHDYKFDNVEVRRHAG